MKMTILQRLYDGHCKSASIGIAGLLPVPAGIHFIDEEFQVMTLLNGKGNQELKDLRKRGNVLVEEE